MGRSFMLHVRVFFAMVGVLVTLAWLQHAFGHDFRHHGAPIAAAGPTTSSPVSSVAAVDEVDAVLSRKLERGELSCVNGYVSVLRMENGTARAYVIRTNNGPARCVTRNGHGSPTSL